MSTIRLLQDCEIENYGCITKNVNDLMEEVRGLFDNYTIKSSTSTNTSPNKFGLTASPISYKSCVVNRNGIESPLYIQCGNGNSNNNTRSPSPLQSPNSKSSINNNNCNYTTSNERLFKLNSQIETIINGSSSSLTTTTALLTPLGTTPIFNIVDLKKYGIKELSSLLIIKRNDWSFQLSAIKQIEELYKVACNSNSSKHAFLEEIYNGTCLRTLLSYLTTSQPKFESFEYYSQLESIRVIAVLSGNDCIKTFIKQNEYIGSIVQVLNWSQKMSNSYNLFNMNLISLISNLATQESSALILRRSIAIPPISSISTSEYNSNELRIIALNTLIIFASYSDPKISEAIVDSKYSLELIFKNIVANTIGSNNTVNVSSNQLSIKFLDLLYQISDCPKTRAVATECGIENLTSLIRIDAIYPSELNRTSNLFKINTPSSSSSSSVSLPDSVLLQSNLQSKVLACLEKLSFHNNNRIKIGMRSTDLIISFLQPCFNIPKESFRWNIKILERVLNLSIQILQDDDCLKMFLENDCAKVIAWMMTTDQFKFSSCILLSCVEILNIVITKNSSDLLISTDLISPLIKLYDSYQNERSLQISICKIFKQLGSIDENKEIIFSNGGITLLHNWLNSKDLEVVSHSLDTLSIISTNNNNNNGSTSNLYNYINVKIIPSTTIPSSSKINNSKGERRKVTFTKHC